MKIAGWFALVAVVLGSSVCHAESDTQKSPTQRLSVEEREILEEGEISTGMRIAGGVTGSVLGLGIGHIFIGKYSEMGWIFTVTEIAAMGLVAGSAVGTVASAVVGDGEGVADNLTLYVFSATVYMGLRVWEAVDVWVRPNRHNRRVRAIQDALDDEQVGQRITAAPLLSQHMAPGLGLTVTF